VQSLTLSIALPNWSRQATALVAIMRQNARFRAGGSGGGAGGAEHPLVHGLSGVRLHFKQPAAGKRADYIAPFVDLITSPETPGHITGAALMAVDRLLREGVVEHEEDLALVLRGVLACRFEQCDAAEDEKVLATMFGVLESASDLSLIRHVPASLIGEMLGALRTYAKEARFSVLLRALSLAALRKTITSLTHLLTVHGRAGGARDKHREGEIMCTLFYTLVGMLEEENGKDIQTVALSAMHTALSYLAAAAAEDREEEAPGSSTCIRGTQTRLHQGNADAPATVDARADLEPVHEQQTGAADVAVANVIGVGAGGGEEQGGQGGDDEERRREEQRIAEIEALMASEGWTEGGGAVGSAVGSWDGDMEVRLTKFVTASVAPALVTLAVNPLTPPPLLARALNALVLVYRYARHKEGGGLAIRPGPGAKGGGAGKGLGGAGGSMFKNVMEIVVQHAFLGLLLEPSLYGEEAREVVLRALCDLVRVQCLLPDLYANYDCCITSQNLYERLVQVVCKQVVCC